MVGAHYSSLKHTLGISHRIVGAGAEGIVSVGWVESKRWGLPAPTILKG